MLPNFKKLDEIDVLISGAPTPESDRAMTEYIKAHEEKKVQRHSKARSIPSSHTKPKAKAKH